MNYALTALGIAAAVLLLCYVLYINGFLILSIKRATAFMGTIRGRRRCRGQFTACTGTMKRVFKVKESREYTYTLDCKLSRGEMAVTIQDAKKNRLMLLEENGQSATIKLEAGKRYYLTFAFGLASGRYELRWDDAQAGSGLGEMYGA